MYLSESNFWIFNLTYVYIQHKGVYYHLNKTVYSVTVSSDYLQAIFNGFRHNAMIIVNKHITPKNRVQDRQCNEI